MKLVMKILYACIIWTITLSASAHEDAQGVVKERMNSMNQMSNAMKVISEFARANRKFESAQIIEQIGMLRNHSGQNLIALFPMGTSGAPSEVREEVWSNWDEFEKLAEELSDSVVSLFEFIETSNLENSAGDRALISNGATSSNNEDLGEFQERFKGIGKICSECHSQFRLNKLN